MRRNKLAMQSLPLAAIVLLATFQRWSVGDEGASTLRLRWEKELLTIAGDELPGGEVEVWHVEAFCRAGSTDRDWNETVIKHHTTLTSASSDGRRIELESRLADGVVVQHVITAGADEVAFQLTAHNPTKHTSQVAWGQPCIRVDKFTGRGQDDYLPKSFVFVDGKLTRMPFEPWARKARYTPGQVWCPGNVDRDDVNPRPLSKIVPSNGLIGCFSGDGRRILATAWEPYQELFQGIIVCLHSDFRIGGLKPEETKTARGKIYLMEADVPALLRRYNHDFPEHAKQ